ncbi:MAG: uncharacterized protein QG629_341 [Patescibacteria group bacterium]|nr:uncharacterized protein [Patescibacteria group bacterium]
MVVIVVAFLAPRVSAETTVPPKPTNCPVQDQAQVLDAAAESRLCKTLLGYEKKTGNQLAVLTVRTLDGAEITDYANTVARAWGVGNKDANNGVLFVAAIDDSKMRIEVGRGLEPMLTDLQSNQIIRTKIRPYFQKGSYAVGIQTGVESMISVIGGERLSEPSRSSDNDLGSLAIFALQFAFIPFIYLASFLGRSKSWWAGGVIGALPGIVVAFYYLIGGLVALVVGVALGLLLDFILSKNYQARASGGDDTTWWGSGGGFSGGSSGDGGWGGFGGGDFGGGGASGDW